jgi:hypothetical protein
MDLEYQAVPLVSDFREFSAKCDDGSVTRVRAALIGDLRADMHEEALTCSWAVQGCITTRLQVERGSDRVGWIEVTTTYTDKSLAVTNRHSGKFLEVAARYQSDLEGVRTKVNENLQCRIASDLPSVERLVLGLPGVIGLIGT